MQSPAYRWDGYTRKDGPLLLFQYTIEGEGVFESGAEAYRIDAGRAFMSEIPGDHRYYFPEGGPEWSFMFILMRPSLILPNWQEAKSRMGQAPHLPATSLANPPAAGHMGASERRPDHGSFYSFLLCVPVRVRTVPFCDRAARRTPALAGKGASGCPLYRHALRQHDQPGSAVGEARSVEVPSAPHVCGRDLSETPSEYLNRVRIEQAMRLLRQTDLGIERIAEEVGYSGGSYFIKVFRKMTRPDARKLPVGTGAADAQLIVF